MVSRATWDAKYDYDQTPTNIHPEQGGVAIHYNGPALNLPADHSRCDAAVLGIERFHVQTRGWSGIAYTLLACPCPSRHLYVGRGLGKRTAANGTTVGNDHFYAIMALIGKGETPTDDLLATLRYGIDYLRAHGAGGRVVGHRDLYSTDCPGPKLYSWVKAGAPYPGFDIPPLPGGDTDDHTDGWTATLMKNLPTLAAGDVGKPVMRVQALLNVANSTSSGARLVEDGVFGHKTEDAVAALQAGHKLTDDGIVGRKTWPILLGVA